MVREYKSPKAWLAQEDIIKAFLANTASSFPEMEFFARLNF
jgi:hypothetical protein